ncbi:MAG: hypothetical protein E7327_07590 [Clostridiales bacterium]|nr:hypothetical protein [Clostridiales bacterium]
MASKQINYYMDYESFRLLAQKALDEGCSILLNELTDAPQCPARDLRIVTPEHTRYFFCAPGFEPEFVRARDGRFYPDLSDMRMVMMLEAGYSAVQPDGLITRERLFSASNAVVGFRLVPRPAEVGRLYDTLARLVRRLAPLRAYTHPDGETEKWNVSPAIAALAGEDGGRLRAIAWTRSAMQRRMTPPENENQPE